DALPACWAGGHASAGQVDRGEGRGVLARVSAQRPARAEADRSLPSLRRLADRGYGYLGRRLLGLELPHRPGDGGALERRPRPWLGGEVPGRLPAAAADRRTRAERRRPPDV